MQFTRYPDGLAGALKKAETWANNRILTPAAEEVSHIFFNNVRDDDQNEWTSTHPPLAERVRRLDPGFNKTIAPPEFSVASARAEASGPAKVETQPDSRMVRLEKFLTRLPIPTDEHLAYATKLLESLPKPIVNAARKPEPACALVYTLLLSSESTVRNTQLNVLKRSVHPGIFEGVRVLLPTVAQMDIQAKLPLVEITLPALRRLSNEQCREFLQVIQQIADSDGHVDVFEFALQKLLRRHLEAQSEGYRKPPVRFLRIRPLAPSCSVLLSVLAHVGEDIPEKIAAAFSKGGMCLGVPADELTLLGLAECNLTRLENALSEISEAADGIKNLVLNACVQTVSADGFIGIKEAELLRAIAGYA